jgi:hypothetical protein
MLPQTLFLPVAALGLANTPITIVYQSRRRHQASLIPGKKHPHLTCFNATITLNLHLDLYSASPTGLTPVKTNGKGMGVMPIARALSVVQHT